MSGGRGLAARSENIRTSVARPALGRPLDGWVSALVELKNGFDDRDLGQRRPVWLCLEGVTPAAGVSRGSQWGSARRRVHSATGAQNIQAPAAGFLHEASAIDNAAPVRSHKAKRIESSYHRDRRHERMTDAADVNATARCDALTKLRFEQCKATHMRERANG